MVIAGIDECGKSEECCNATPDPFDKKCPRKALI
jgi:hypothetical protein